MLNYIMSNYMSLVLKVRPGSTEQKPDSFGLLNGLQPIGLKEQVFS